MGIIERKDTCKYLNCSAAGESPITSLASRNARDAFCSPSAAITYMTNISNAKKLLKD